MCCFAICLARTKPTDFGDLDYDNVPRSAEGKDDSHESEETAKDSYSGNIYDTGIFTKYPDSPTDDGGYEASYSRQKRNTSNLDALDVNQLFFDKVYNASRPERNADDKKDEIPLRGLITAIETELVDSAEKINSNVSNQEQLSVETTTEIVTEKPDDDDDSIDVNKNFFDEIFEFTRAQRQTTVEKTANKTIPLNGLVQAVESTLVNSAQKLQKAETKKSSAEKVEKIPADAEVKERKTRSADHDDEDDDDDDDEKDEKTGKNHFAVEKLTPTKNVNLDLLKPITFKTPASESSDESHENESGEVSSTTPAVHVQSTNFTVVRAKNSTHIIPNADNKTIHVQHQQISQTVFHSTLAILPTISPNNINVPSIASTTTTQTSVTETVDAVTDKNKESNESQKLKEKVAEVEAIPIILSQGI